MSVYSLKDNLRLFGKLDKVALFFHLVLLSIGVLFIYGTGMEVGGELSVKWIRQLQWIIGGMAVYLFCAFIDYRKLASYSWLLYLISLILLVLVLVIGSELNNAKSWIQIGGFTIQPSELAKPATLLFLCWVINHPAWRRSPVPIWMLIVLIILPPLVLVLAQPDFGTALVFFPFSIALAYIKGFKGKWIVTCALILVILCPFLYQWLRPHQQDRIKVFLKPPSDAILISIAPFISEKQLENLTLRQNAFFAPRVITAGDGKTQIVKHADDYNARQSLLAVGSGGISGKGFLKGTQHILGFLPRSVAPSDFIFSVIAEETGFFGSIALLIMLIGTILCCCRTALIAEDSFGLCLALGTGMIFATHVFINIGMTIQAAPIIGIPLPFISYGGSFMLCTMILAGLCQSVHSHHQQGTQQP